MAPTLQDRPDVAVFGEIGVIEHLIRQSVQHHLPSGMTFAHFELLQHFIRNGDGQTPAELARVMLLSNAAPATTQQNTGALRVVSALGDVADGRKKRVRLTRAGLEQHAAVIKAMKWKMELLREGFTDAEFRQALPFLRNLRRFLEEVSAGPAPGAESRR